MLLLLSAAALWQAGRTAQFNPTDYAAWQGDWTAVASCLDAPAVPCSGVSKFPLAYLMNAGLAGSGHVNDRSMLTTVNVVSLLLPALAFLWLQRGRGAHLIYPYLASILLSPLPLFYIASGAMELQSAVFSGLYLGAFVRLLEAGPSKPSKDTGILLFSTGLIFPLYKDTAAVLVGAACLVLLWLHRHQLRQWAGVGEGRRFLWRAAAVAAVPVALAVTLSAFYNLFRYGTPLPLGYMEEARQTLPTLGKSAEFLAGSLLSPNGGALVFWTFPVFVALAGWRLEGWVPRRAALIGSGLVLAISALAFARWWAPFGWDSWGNRLLLPPTFALIVAAMISLRPRRIADQAVSQARVVAFGASLPVIAVSAMYILAPYLSSAERAMPDSLWPGAACDRMRQALPEQALAEGMAFWRGQVYYDCARERMLHIPAPR
ncbi:hypothetical protein [Luteimonas sp. TWI1437]|uniref:hypothetical protein n=1 Tax=unclassified Luteimonas TaxID=2629088 RepID=UPI00320B7D2B